ncbi:hypothetical protein JCM19239_2040 [Vibrio variabilis]|uniref:ATPase n=1 Tax=Vibrio variabilis TaxID=990271 RepID=A0ABQ0J737_9VIBR|nr:hypothetical protein JCM19239_2040 [Vibrio variabilis]
MKRFIFVAALLMSAQSLASSEIRSSSGATCEQSDFQPWELSFGGGRDNRDYSDYDSYDRTQTEDTGKYIGAQITYSFGGAKQIDCSRFQSIVEREQEAHTKQLEMKIKELEQRLEKQTQVSQLASKIKFK